MAIEAANASWLTLVTSSAVVSAIVNVGWNAWSKRVDRKREDAKEAKRIGHVYLDIALQLEGFVKRCDARLYDIDRGLAEMAAEHNQSYLSELKPFGMSFDPEPNWSELPIRFVAKMKVLPDQYASTKAWIGEQWEYWADLDDAYRLEEQSIAYYGLKAAEIAAEIRRDIDAGIADNAKLLEHFRSEIEQCMEAFRVHPKDIALIPELEAEFTAKFPQPREIA
ncbi:hypothetical protein PQR46_18690 [Paraburkholderia sediminicola]|uniref:hypothetical protein n=1 Tax=Paraburkholderia sediminicola TaxID=458836 RepID=UPI0038BD2FB5